MNTAHGMAHPPECSIREQESMKKKDKGFIGTGNYSLKNAHFTFEQKIEIKV